MIVVGVGVVELGCNVVNIFSVVSVTEAGRIVYSMGMGLISSLTTGTGRLEEGVM